MGTMHGNVPILLLHYADESVMTTTTSHSSTLTKVLIKPQQSGQLFCLIYT
jgi:hypothetical protein